MRIVFLCKGSRGDVAPLLALAVGFRRVQFSMAGLNGGLFSFESHVTFKVFYRKSSCVGDSCTLATHFSHKKKFDRILQKYGIDFMAVDATEDEAQVDEKREIDKVELKVSSGRGFSNSERQDRVIEMHSSLRACRGANAIVFNLFACEGWFIGQYLRVPCVVASPFAITRSPPVTFESKFADAYPDLYQRLREAPRGCVSYSDVDHWMWRLYLDDFGEFCDTLDLPVCPFANLRPHDRLPRATELFYGISPRVVDQQGYWPESITFCGYWYLENPDDSLEDITVRCPSNCPSSSSCNLPQFLWDLNGNKEKPVFINFGSMEELGFFDSLDDVELIGTLNEGLVECGMKAILQLGVNSSLLKAWDMLCKNVKHCNIYCLTGYVPHSLLFPQCRVIVHHGGSGTVGSALKAGVPQIVCPFMFDQSYWADKITWMELGESVGHPRSLTTKAFTDALRKASSSEIEGNAYRYGQLVEKEEGVMIAVEHIKQAFGR